MRVQRAPSPAERESGDGAREPFAAHVLPSGSPWAPANPRLGWRLLPSSLLGRAPFGLQGEKPDLPVL